MGMTSWERAVIALIAIAIVGSVIWVVGTYRSRLRYLAWATAGLTFVLIVLGAYVRLADAGLGCPDWPGCYGQLTPALASEAIHAEHALAPTGPVSMRKAWKEMAHRYLAMIVGCLILGIAISATRQRGAIHNSHPAFAWIMVAVVVFQAVLGAWTVTWLLKPVVVTAHLLGGMATLALLVWYAQSIGTRFAANAQAVHVRRAAFFALTALIVQLALGGWVSTNYAASACGNLPLCQGVIWPEMDFEHGFHLVRELGKTAQGEMLSLASLTAIHMTHRLFAFVVVAGFGLMIVRAWRVPGLKPLAVAVCLALITQVFLGFRVVWSMSNAHLDLALQLPTAAAHNAVAALLLVLTLLINYRARLARRLHS